MKELNSFTALIQLISAVNFAYIVPYFHEKVYAVLFNEDKFYSDKITYYQDLMIADQESLKTMKDNANDGATQKAIDDLIEKCKKLSDKWNVKMDETRNMVDWVMNRKGFKSLFLFTSLFCIVDLLNIALTNVYNYNIFFMFTYLMTILSFFYVLKLTWRILFSGWKNKDDVFCYKRSIRYFIQSFIFAFIFALLNCWLQQYVSYSIFKWVTSIVVILSVAIPFYPIVFIFLFIGGSVKFINLYTTLNTRTVREEQKQLNLKKQELECKMNPTKNASWGKSGS